MAAHAAHISGMTTYDEGKHPRGQVGNAGQFRNKSWSDPEAALTASTEPVQPLAVIAESVVLANYLPAEAVVFANYLPEDGQTAEDVLQEALNDRVLGANDIMSLICAGVIAARESRVSTPDRQVNSGISTAPFRASNRYTLKAISPAGS